MGEIGLGLPVRNCNYGRNGIYIGNRRWSSVKSIYIVGIVSPLIGMPELLMMTVKAMMFWAMPPIGFSMGVVIWSIWVGLGTQGV